MVLFWLKHVADLRIPQKLHHCHSAAQHSVIVLLLYVIVVDELICTVGLS